MIWPWKAGKNAQPRAKDPQASEKRKTLTTAVVPSPPQLAPSDAPSSRVDKRQSAPVLNGTPSGTATIPPPARRGESDEEITALKKQIRQFEADFVKLDEERQRQIRKLKADLQNHSKETEAKQRVVELRTRERDEAQKARDDARHARDDAHRSLDVFQGQVKQLQEQFGMIEERRKQVDTDAEGKRKVLEDAAAAKDEELEAVRAELNEAAAAKDKELESVRSELEDATAARETELASLRLELESAAAVKDKELESVRAELGQVRENAQTLDAGNAALNETVEAVKAEAEKSLEALRLELRIASDKADMIEISNRSLNQDLEIAQAQSKAFASLGEDLEATKADLKNAIARAETHEATNKELLVAKASIAAELEGAKNELTLKAEALERKNKELESELEKAKVQAPSNAKEVHDAGTSKHEDEILALSDELETTKAELLKAQSQIFELESHGATNGVNGVNGVHSLMTPPSPSSPSTMHQLRTKSSYRNEFSEPVRFTPFSSVDDFRLGIDRANGEVRVDVREWTGGSRSRRGVAMEVKDAQELVRLLPHVVAAAGMIAGETTTE